MRSKRPSAAPMALHLTKIAFGRSSVAELEAALAMRAPTARLTTRYRPKRDAEITGGLDGGSLYWIIAHRIVGRSPIIAFEKRDDGKTDIAIEARVIPVRPYPRRAHQGWRYLEASAAPPDLGGGDADLAELPAHLHATLSGMGLV